MQKKALTLMEIMIVIFLITLITGAIGYNMKGSLDKGKKFKTDMAKERLHELLLMALNEGKATAEEIAAKPEQYLTALEMVSNVNNLLVDGYGKKFEIKAIDKGTNFDITLGK